MRQTAEMVDATTAVKRRDLIAIADIIDRPDWPTDPAKVEGFRETLRRGGSFGPLRVNEVPHGGPDGRMGYDIIDAFHRYRALVLEGVTYWPADIHDYDEETANEERIAASANQTDHLLYGRALLAIRETFNRDILKRLDGMQLYESVYDEQGNLSSVPREGPPPTDPIEMLWAFVEHQRAKPEVTQVGERVLGDFLAHWNALLPDRPTNWLRDQVLGMSQLGDGLKGKDRGRFIELLGSVPDREIRDLVRYRLIREKLNVMTFRGALDWLGCLPKAHRTPGMPVHSREWMQRALHAQPLAELAAFAGHWINERDARLQAQAEAARQRALPQTPPQPLRPPAPSVPTPPPPPLASPRVALPATAPVHVNPEHIIGQVSPSFTEHQAPQFARVDLTTPPPKPAEREEPGVDYRLLLSHLANAEVCEVESRPHELFLRLPEGVNPSWVREQARRLLGLEASA